MRRRMVATLQEIEVEPTALAHVDRDRAPMRLLADMLIARRPRPACAVRPPRLCAGAGPCLWLYVAYLVGLALLGATMRLPQRRSDPALRRIQD